MRSLSEGKALVSGIDPVLAELDVIGGHVEMFRHCARHAAPDFLCRIESGHTVEIGPSRRRRRRGVGYLVGPRRRNLYVIDVNLKDGRHHLRHLDEQPLPHLRTAVVQMYAAVGVDMHQGAGLI